SPLIRCMQTSEIILKDRNIEIMQVDALKEINMGEWEYKTFDYVKSRFPQQYEKRGIYMDCFVPPGGESFEQLQKRVMPAFDEIIGSSNGNILIVAHAGVNRVILSKLMAFPLKDIMKLSQPYGCVNILHMDKTYQVWNCETML
ncbi:MAG TPA: histidine phosphatase family protein, partial [Bacillota bacterium]|nr:histidine phosphatase family protein [Bacillota bacterium]